LGDLTLFRGLVFLFGLLRRCILLEPGLNDFVLLDLIAIGAAFFLLVCLNRLDLVMFTGAVQVLGLATTLPFRDPVVQRYLRTAWPPLLPQTVVADSTSSRKYINVSYLLLI